jgi:cytochrome c
MLTRVCRPGFRRALVPLVLLVLALQAMPEVALAQAAQPPIQTPPAPSLPGTDAAMRGHGGPVRALAQMPGGRLASGGFDSTIIIWDLARGQATRVLRQHETAVNALVSRPDGCLVSGGDDGRIKIWCDAPGSAPAAAPMALNGHDGAVSALALSADGKTLASGSWDRTVRVWDAAGGSTRIAEHPTPVSSILVLRDGGAVVSASQDGTVRLTPVGGSGTAARVLKLDAAVNTVVQSGDALILGCTDGVVRETDLQLGRLRDVAKLDGPLTAVAVSPDGLTIAVGGLRTAAALLERATGGVKPAPLGNGLPFAALLFSDDGRELFTGGLDRTVRRFDARSGTAISPAIPTAPKPEIADGRDRGARVFRACGICHGLTAADTNLAGPTLHQIMGRRIASLKGYEYSPGLTAMDLVWTPETVAKLFEVGPTLYTPGTKMPEQRLTDPADRQALVEWLTRVTVP